MASKPESLLLGNFVASSEGSSGRGGGIRFGITRPNAIEARVIGCLALAGSPSRKEREKTSSRPIVSRGRIQWMSNLKFFMYVWKNLGRKIGVTQIDTFAVSLKIKLNELLVHILADLAYQPQSLTNPIEDPVINARQDIILVVAFWTINATWMSWAWLVWHENIVLALPTCDRIKWWQYSTPLATEIPA